MLLVLTPIFVEVLLHHSLKPRRGSDPALDIPSLDLEHVLDDDDCDQHTAL